MQITSYAISLFLLLSFVFLFIARMVIYRDRLSGLVVRVPGYRSGGLDSRALQEEK
jgi:hypothetical protein